MADPSSSAETAANFGYTLAFFNSSPELKKLLADATKGAWTPGRFVAALQNTKWFRTASESNRKFQVLRASDPATYKQQIQQGAVHVMNMAGQFGSNISADYSYHVAETAMKFGWTDDQLKNYLSQRLKTDAKGNYRGQAASFQSQFRGLAEEYGVDVSDQVVTSYVRSALRGEADANTFKAYTQQLAASKYVALKDRIMAGESVRQIADPYMQSYAKLLEVDGENIKLDDPLIQRALQAKDSKGKPTTQTVYDFEQTLRNDARWRKTDNAQDVGMATANAILKQFGQVS